MTTAAIKRKLHDYIEVANDKTLKAIYTLLEQDVEQTTEEYSNEFKAELDRRYAEYKNGGKVVSREDLEKEIEYLLASPAMSARLDKAAEEEKHGEGVSISLDDIWK